MCDVARIAVFCSGSIECIPCTASKCFFKLLVTIPVAPIITGTIVHERFHIRCISIYKLLYFNFFFASFCTTFLPAGIATSISVHVFSFLFYYYYYYYCLLLQLSCHSVAVVPTLVETKQIRINIHKRNNTIQTIQSTVNTSTHIQHLVS